ncbi:hypothetical protein GCM10023328_46660 [Modestobacter marinus]|uniref:Uncharacterized protein n=1 Tax=Modestobacter marinus TaxID=477641 RepID=A0ABQ2GCF3_9ACTN|nr:hypothetical protein GCM10011589_48190 [Modestobacter marinus]
MACRRFTGPVIFEPRASDLELVDVENALLRAAVGDYALEAAVLLLANGGHWLPLLQAAGLIDLEPDPAGGETWAQVRWDDARSALQAGTVAGDDGQELLLRAAGSLADGQPVDLGDLTGDLDQASLQLLLAALAHAAGSHDQEDPDVPHFGEPLSPLVAWPARG